MCNGKKTFNAEVYGKITYKEDFWEMEEPVKFKICNRDMQVKSEIEIYNMMHLGIFSTVKSKSIIG
ncbi:hypothetical protein [Clostridium saccharobutylicum]|uniref:hypothetical protein n=1 Tax=Clostridium saccharobutylicum TaxID=169679 RepID=UPI00098C0B71|nr:hypothetical protein [Clostridium saccharobutylicum]